MFIGKKIIQSSVMHASSVILDQGMCSVANFLTGVMIARACTKSEYGVFVLGLTILRFLTGIQNSIISVPYAIQYPRCKNEDLGMYLGSTYVHQFVVCFLAAFVFFSFACVIALQGGNHDIASMMFVLTVASTAFMLREFVRHIMLAELRFWLNLAMSLVVNVSTVVVIYIAYNIGCLNSAKAYLIITICSGIPAVVISVLYFKKVSIDKSRIMLDFKNNFKLGKWIVARSLANTGAISFYPFLLAYFYDTAQAGVYGVCIQFSSLLNPVFMGLGSYLRPKTSHLAVLHPEKLLKYILKISIVLLIFILMVYVVCIIYGYKLVLLIYGQQYAGCESVLLICLFGVSISVLSSPILRYHEALARTDIPFKAGISGLILTATLGVYLVASYGVIGAAVGFCLAHSIVFVVNVYMMKKHARRGL